METHNIKANFPCDMHSHSCCSDGLDTPGELICRAADLGIRVLVLSDHDVIPPKHVIADTEEIDICTYARERGVYLIPGMEISCETEVEDVHLVCIGCDWDAPFFREFETQVKRSKLASYQLLVEKIIEDGYCISWEKLLSWNGFHIEPEKIQKKRIFEVLAEIGFAEDWAKAKIKIKNTPRYQIHREKPSAVHVIQEVHRAGGIVILAHPYLIADNISFNGKLMSREQYIDMLAVAGLDGIEARYTYDKTSYIGEKSKSQIEVEVMQKYKNRLKIISGGSDYHGVSSNGKKSYRELGECGLLWQEFNENVYLRRVVENLYGGF